jgi:hypothetical protein
MKMNLKSMKYWKMKLKNKNKNDSIKIYARKIEHQPNIKIFIWDNDNIIEIK